MRILTVLVEDTSEKICIAQTLEGSLQICGLIALDTDDTLAINTGQLPFLYDLTFLSDELEDLLTDTEEAPTESVDLTFWSA